MSNIRLHFLAEAPKMVAALDKLGVCVEAFPLAPDETSQRYRVSLCKSVTVGGLSEAGLTTIDEMAQSIAASWASDLMLRGGEILKAVRKQTKDKRYRLVMLALRTWMQEADILSDDVDLTGDSNA